jgi:hypothetical protein
MDAGLILVAVCGLSLVCVGTFVVVAIIGVRTTGVRLWDAFNGIGGIFGVLSTGEDDEPEATAHSADRRGRRSRQDLRARAQELDFGSAVARHTGESTPPAAAQSTGTAPREPGTRLPTYQPTGSQRLRGHREEEDEDEIFGGFLDDDGDGTVDF